MSKSLDLFAFAAAILFLFVRSAPAQEEKTVVVFTDGIRDTCRILFAADSALALWEGDSAYSSLTAPRYGTLVHPADLDTIVLVNETHLGRGMLTGAIIGSAAGVVTGFLSGNDEPGILSLTAGQKALWLGITFGAAGAISGGILAATAGLDKELALNGERERYTSVLPILRNRAMLNSGPLPAGLGYRSGRRPATVNGKEAGTADSKRPGVSTFSRIHISVSAAAMLTGSAAGDVISAFNSSGFGGTVGGWFGPVEYPVDVGKSVSFSASAEYSLARRLRLGLIWSGVPDGEVHGSELESETTSGNTYGITCTFLLIPSDPPLGSNLEFAFTGGVTYNLLNVDGRLAVSYPQAETFVENSRKIGFMGSLGCDYYFSNYISIHAGLTGQFIPSPVSVGEFNYTSPVSGITKTLTAHEVNFSRLDISGGLSLHL